MGGGQEGVVAAAGYRYRRATPGRGGLPVPTGGPRGPQELHPFGFVGQLVSHGGTGVASDGGTLLDAISGPLLAGSASAPGATDSSAGTARS